MIWNTENITLRDGRTVFAVAPVIISASRATDIPAFYGEWFVNRLKAGYVRWVNPFNHASQFVSFSKVRAFVFWTKNFAPSIPCLHLLDERGIGYYIQYTLNDYESESLEPHLPALSRRIADFQKLSRLVGLHKVIWRFDPVLVGNALSIDQIVDRIAGIASKLRPYTAKLVFSFADIDSYVKVRRNLGASFCEPDHAQMMQFAGALSSHPALQKFEIASCAEKIDLSRFGIAHNRCIDPDLLGRLFPHDRALMHFLSAKNSGKNRVSKDKGQRKECGCMVSKDIGSYTSCAHGCVYCYANASPTAAKNASMRHDPASETII